jgi:hypothetical protein
MGVWKLLQRADLMMTTFRRLSTLGFLAVALSGSVSPAQANALPVGATTAIIAASVMIQGTAVAYDATNHVYLVVAGDRSVVWGRFVAANGAPLGGPFVIKASPTYTFFPGVAFSPDANGGAGGFLVAWHETDLPGANTSIHTRMVAWGQSGPYGAETVANTNPTFWVTPIQIAYSTTSKEFLVVFSRVHGAGGYGVEAVGVDNNAAVSAPTFIIAVNNQYEDNPSIAYNPVTDQFLVSYSGWSAGLSAFIATRLVQAGSNQLLGAAATILYQSLGTWITATVYNPRTNQFLVTWVGGAANPLITSGRLVNADATLPGNVIALSSRWESVDGMDVDYNPVTDTYFLVASTPLSGEDGGVELTGATGVPVDNGFLVTSGAGRSGRPFPRIRASTQDPNWLISVTNSFLSTDIQLITGTASGTPPSAPGPVSRPLVDVDTPGNSSVVSTNGFVIAGWAVDMGATSGTGVDNVIAWAFPSTGGAAILAGVAAYGGARPDVAAALGNNANFTASGYGLTAVLPQGSYTLAVYAHSIVNNSWNTPTLKSITVQPPAPPPSNPLMWVDLPSQNQTLSSAQGGITVGGWAVDLASTSGPGVDAVHVWAYPQGGAAPQFVGWSTTGGARPDIGAWLGSQFSTAGFYVTGTLQQPGNYTLVVFAHSAVTGTFNDVKTVNIIVQ